jgi:outer membrane receptor protein involved in Fe transport
MNNPSWMGFTLTAVAVAAAVVAAAPAMAQSTTSNVTGRVVGADGAPVAGATVTIVHIESGSTSTSTTDAQGRYGVRGLRPGGPYTITVTGGGLTDRQENVFLALAETTVVDSRLAPTQTIVVTGAAASATFNSANMGAGTRLGSRDLETGASINRNLQDYARNDPRLSQIDKERGEIVALGQNNRFNSITIDGVTTNDTFGLEANNLPTLKQPISIDAIQSVQVNVSNYDVTQTAYTGANINAVTKSGTNEFSGSVYYVFRNDSLAGKRFNRSTGQYIDPPSFEETLTGVTLGGPIIKDRLFFFVSYEELESSRNAPSFGPLGSTQTNVGIRPEAITQAQSIASGTWGMDIGSGEVPSGVSLDVKDILLKLDWNISDDHRVSVRYTKTEQTEPIFPGLSGTALSLSSYWYNQDKEFSSVVGQWFADWTTNFSTELKISQRDYFSTPTPINGQRLPQTALRFSGPAPTGVASGNRDLLFGTERSRHFNVLETDTLDVYAAGNLFLGDHELKFGLDYADNDIFNAFLQDTRGQYRFQCENSSATWTYSFGDITCNGATAAQIEAAVLENFQLGRPSFYQAQLPLAGRTLDDGVAQWQLRNLGVFIQDTWTVNRDLSLMFGVRLDRQSVPTKPLANTAAAAAPVAGNVTGGVVTRASGGFGLDNTETLDGNTLVQPRFGFNWNFGEAERRMQLRGGLGLFQGAAANVWLSNPFSNTGTATAFFSCANRGACENAGATFNPDPDNPPTLSGQPPAANVDFLDPSLEQPSVWKANLAFETELPELPVVGRLVAGAEWVHTKVNAGLYYQHLNLGAPTRIGSDGRELFHNPLAGYEQACWNPSSGAAISSGACALPSGQVRTRALSNPNFNNVLVAKKTSKGGGDAITLSLGKPTPREGLGWSLAYTRTTAKEVSGLTSSVSNSNFNSRSIFNPNDEVESNSAYLTRDRFNGSLNWSKAFFGNNRTSIGVFYEGRRGRPYSWVFGNDMNGDGVTGNDLMYIPSAPGSGEVVFRGGADEEARFWQIVDANEALSKARGGVVARNTSYSPFVNQFDLRIAQELPGFMAKHKATISFDIFNFGNLLNKKWGRIDEVGFNGGGGQRRTFVNYSGVDAQGRYIYSLRNEVSDLTTRQNRGESQWAVQATLRYSF